jgi:predicted nucleotidyltransferase
MGVAALEFGGRTIDSVRLASDIDLLYVLRPGARIGFAIDDLEDDLADLFGRGVDLIARKAVHPLLRPGVEGQARTVYAA